MSVFADAIVKAKPIAMRRCKWLVMEATSENPAYDLATRFSLRAVSNYVHFGKCYDSKKIKELNNLVSIGALEQLQELNYDFEKWHNKTDNEHPRPLNHIWCELRQKAEGANDLDALADWLYEELAKCEMVTVLKTEHKKMPKHSPVWQTRYADADIYLASLVLRPRELCKQLSK
jgi:hypothetical protein